jgi:hypothetical protein
MAANTYAAKVMSLKSSSPTTIEYSEKFLNSNDKSIPKICYFGMNCKSFKPGQAACAYTHVDNPSQQIAEVKQKLAESRNQKLVNIEKEGDKNIKGDTGSTTTTPDPIVDSVIPSVNFNGSKYDISVISNFIPNAKYSSVIADLNKGTITFNIINENTAFTPIKAVEPTNIFSEPPKLNADMNVSFGNTKNIFSNLTKFNTPVKDDVVEEKKSDWSTVVSKHDKKQMKEKKEEEEKEKEKEKMKSSSPVPNLIAKGRSSPVPNLIAKKDERSSPVPNVIAKKEERFSPIAKGRSSPDPASFKKEERKVTTSKKPCNFKDKCNKKDCTFEHPEGYIPGSVSTNVCHNADKCYNQYCKFTHPDGYIPKPNVRCLGADQCHKEAARKGSCPFSHPNDPYYDSIPENTRKNNKN